MESIKIQINHTSPIIPETLSSLLYDEIGEEYNIEFDTIKEYFDFEYTYILPNESFISIITFQIPKFELRDIELNDIILSFLNSVQELENVISITKVNDTNFQKLSTKYYEEIIDLEMDMRNVLTYIITYDNRRINKELFESFGINISDDLQSDKIKKNYENGLFYILFKDYKSFLEIKPLGNTEITKLLQNPLINSFEEFKEKLRSKINEERHLDFLASVEAKFKQLDNTRNSVMHIHSLSEGEKRSYTNIMQDTTTDKSLKTIIKDFWNNEKEILNKETAIELGLSAIEELFDNSFFIGSLLDISDDITNEYIAEEYTDVSDLQDDLLGYLTDEVNVTGYEYSDEDYGVFLSAISDNWDAKESHI